jgi:hypothetical protein
MATTQMDTYTQVGKAEDVSDIVTMISPTNTPMLTLMGSEKADNTFYQWQEDALDAPASNAQVEGAPAPAASESPTSLRTNYTQIFAKTIQVTGSAREMKLHGTNDEFTRQSAKKSKEIKRDLEYALVGTAQTQIAGNSATARKFDGVQAQHLAGNTNANGGTNRPLTETLFLTASQTAYTNGSEPGIAMIKPADSIVVAGFAGATGRGRYLDDGETKLVNVIDVYQGPFGTHKFVLNRWQRTKDLLLVDPSMWKLRPFRNWRTIDLAVTGDFTAKELLGEFGLMHRNFNDGFLLTDLS